LRKKLHKKLLPPELPFLTQICTKSFVGWGFAPDPCTGGAYSVPQNPLLYLGGLLQRVGREGEGKGRGEAGTGGRGREEMGGGRRGGKWRGPHDLGYGAPNVLIRP